MAQRLDQAAPPSSGDEAEAPTASDSNENTSADCEPVEKTLIDILMSIPGTQEMQLEHKVLDNEPVSQRKCGIVWPTY